MGGGGAGGPDGGRVGVRASRCALRDLEPTDRTPGIEPAVLGIEPSGSNHGLEPELRARGESWYVADAGSAGCRESYGCRFISYCLIVLLSHVESLPFDFLILPLRAPVRAVRARGRGHGRR